MLGSKLSADSGAKTMLGFRERWAPARTEIHDWDGIKAINPRGLGTESPEKILLLTTRFASSAHFGFRSFVGPMSPPLTSA